MPQNAVVHIESWFPTPEPTPGRPAGVWVVTVVYGLVYGLLLFVPLVAGVRYTEMMAGLSVFEHVLFWINTGLDLAGVASLFLLLRVAVPLLGGALVVSLVSVASLLTGLGRGSSQVGPDVFSMLLGVVMPLATWWYARRLRDGGGLH